MSFFKSSLVAATLLTASFAANAATIQFASTPTTTASVATNFGPGLARQVNLSLPLFDSTLGTLTSVSLQLMGTINATLRFENLDTDPATITATAAATIGLLRPDGTSLVVVIPTQTQTASVGTYDGSTDYAGTSGRTITGVTATLMNSVTTTAATDLATFTGTGSISLPVSATGTSGETGAGNLSALNTTSAQAGAVVTYTYTPTTVPPTRIPEPASMALLGAGLAGLGLARRRKG